MSNERWRNSFADLEAGGLGQEAEAEVDAAGGEARPDREDGHDDHRKDRKDDGCLDYAAAELQAAQPPAVREKFAGGRGAVSAVEADV